MLVVFIIVLLCLSHFVTFLVGAKHARKVDAAKKALLDDANKVKNIFN